LHRRNRQARAIVAVSDTKLSNESYSHDFGAMKIRALVNRWSVMYSGLPTTFERLQRHINSHLLDAGKPKDVRETMSSTVA
jgi:hypothetical protein